MLKGLRFIIFILVSCSISTFEKEPSFSRIEVLAIYGSTVQNFEIDSMGFGYGIKKVRYPRSEEVYTFKISKNDLDSLISLSNIMNEVEGLQDTSVYPCTGGTRYTISIYGKNEFTHSGLMYCIEDDLIVDDMLSFIFKLEMEVKKKYLFEKYFEYYDDKLKTDSILNELRLNN